MVIGMSLSFNFDEMCHIIHKVMEVSSTNMFFLHKFPSPSNDTFYAIMMRN